MKRICLLLCIMFGVTVLKAQNPFAKYGYEPKIATLSQGKYNEFFDQDSIVQIGSVLFNTHSEQIVGFVKTDTVYGEPDLQPDIVSRWLSPDPLADEFPSWTPYHFVHNNPINLIDPDGRFAMSPIYNSEGKFLGTDDQGLQGDAIVMNSNNFTQGMSHEDALKNSLGISGLRGDAAKKRLADHYGGLKDRPDYDGFVTISEGIEWAKKHPNTLPDNVNPDNSLYLDASKLNFGDLNVENIGLTEGQTGNVNLFNFVNWTSSKSRHTTYALGNTRMKLVNAKTGDVKLFWDNYDWDYHSYPLGRKLSGHLPESKRDKLIFFERQRAKVNDSHGFRLLIYGSGKIKPKE